MLQPIEDVPAVNRQQPPAIRDVDRLRWLMTRNREESGAMDKVSTLAQVERQATQPFVSMTVSQLLSQPGEAQRPISQHADNTHVTRIPVCAPEIPLDRAKKTQIHKIIDHTTQVNRRDHWWQWFYNLLI